MITIACLAAWVEERTATLVETNLQTLFKTEREEKKEVRTRRNNYEDTQRQENV